MRASDQAIGAGSRELLERLEPVVRVIGGCRLEGVCLPGGPWAMRDPSAEPPSPSVRDALVGPAGADPSTIEWAGAGWAGLLRFGRGVPPGALLVSGSRPPAARQLALLRTIVDGLDGARDPRGLDTTGDVDDAPDVGRRLRDLGATRRALTRAAVLGEGLDGVARVTADHLGREVVVWDRSGVVLAAAGGTSGADDLDLRAPLHELDRLPEDAPARRGRWVLVPIRVVGETLGAVGAADPDGTADDLDTARIEQAAASAALELHRQAGLESAELHVWGDLAHALLFDSHRRHVHRHARALGYDLGMPHRLALLEPGLPVGEAAAIVSRSCREQGLRALVAPYDTRLVVVFDARHDWRELARGLRRESRLHELRMGVTRVWPTADRTVEMVREAEMALTVGGLAGAGSPTCFDDLGLLQLLGASTHPETLDDFVADRLGRLLDHDAQRHSSLVETLTAYLDAGAALEPAAEALFIHRSTLKYRLGRIRELLEVDLSDPGARFELQLACRVHVTVEALRARGTELS